MELRSELSKQYLSESLFILMKENDYEKISVQKIVKKAGLSHMAYYRNFGNKDEILIFYVDKFVNDFIVDNNINSVNQTVKNSLTALFDYLYQHKDLGMILLKCDKLHLLQAAFDKHTILNAKNAADRYKRLFISGGAFRLYREYLENDVDFAPQTIVKYIKELK